MLNLDIKIKKDGQQYTKAEMKKMGWTPQLIRERVPELRRNSGGVYYRASDVRKALEAEPSLLEQLAKQRVEAGARSRLVATPDKTRAELARKLTPLLQKAFDEAELDPDTRIVANQWHKLFLGGLLAPQPSAYHEKYRITPGDQVTKRLLDFVDETRNFTAAAWANRWWRIGQTAWTMIANPGDNPNTQAYVQALAALAQKEIRTQIIDKGVEESVSEIFSVPAIQAQYPSQYFLYDCYATFYVPALISRDLSKLIAVDPKDEYPAARQMFRRFEIHVGGTNTGKTYQSLQRLKQAASGVYLAPLRLLALEVQERLLADGVVCSMLTGEEEDIREGATHISSTVEKLNLSQEYEVAVIDECQMINDRERGYAWTRAILGVRASEIHLCVAPEGLHILERLIKALGEPYTVIKHERKVPLRWIDRQVKLKEARKGDAFVAFSKKRVLQLAEELRKLGIPTSIIYGNLPYATRRQQMQMFLNGETTALVATDAIGMGLNLPIRRVIFTQDEKYDGEVVRPLRPGEVRQIAGRAGRFGLYNEGFAAMGPDCDHDLGSMLETVPPSIDQAALGFSDLVLKVDRPLIDVLKVWNQMPVKAPYKRMDISRHISIISYIQNTLKLVFSKEDLLKASNIPFDERDAAVQAQFAIYCKTYAAGKTTLPRPEREGNRLGNLELYYKLLDLYYSFAKTFGFQWDQEWLMEEKEVVAEEINYLLVHDLKKRGASCRRCGGPIALDSPYSICDKCYRKQRQERERQRRYWDIYA